ncbi:MAG: hypothetical protein WBR29_07355 [Gammaproteobacteria bacterium]
MHLPRPTPAPARETEPPRLSPYALFLQEIISLTGKPPSAIATAIHVAQATLTRHLPKKDGTPKPRTPRTMHADTIRKLEDFSGLRWSTSASQGSGGEGGKIVQGGRREIARVASDAVRNAEAANDDIDLSGAIKALVGNRTHAEAWELRSAALECAGYLPGDLLIVDRTALARDGDVVCLNYCPWGRPGQAQTLMRIFRDVGAMRFVIGSTFDPALSDPLPVDNERTVIMGVVTHSIRVARRQA